MKILLLLLSMTVAALAQQPSSTDPVFLKNGINVLINQRNAALNAQVEAEARLMLQMDENAKLRAELEELKKKPPAPPQK